MRKFIIANWKMKLSLEESLRLATKLNVALVKKKYEVIICPDFISLSFISFLNLNKNFILGAQDSAILDKAALTGEISPINLAEAGASYVILGHSERRIFQHEDNKVIREKAENAISAGLKVILCIGESQKERALKKTKQVLALQLKEVLKNLKLKKGAEILIAYEPLWAIGTGKAMCEKEAGEIALFIKKEAEKFLKKAPKVLYGGSIDENNANLFLKQKEISGLLVGGFSLKAEEFIKIC